MYHAGAVEQHVDRTKAFRRCRNRRGIGDVKRHWLDAGQTLQLLGVDVGGNDLRACLSKKFGGTEANPLAGGGDQHAFSS
ncbi:hypothetical protein D3C71_2020700 [compost metagenome]